MEKGEEKDWRRKPEHKGKIGGSEAAEGEGREGGGKRNGIQKEIERACEGKDANTWDGRRKENENGKKSRRRKEEGGRLERYRK